MTCHPLATVIRLAYIGWMPSSLSAPIVGGPGWLESDEYFIDARAAGDQPVAMIRGPMLQAHLEERLMLKIRLEPRETAPGGGSSRGGRGGGGTDALDANVSLFTAIREQLGLRLESTNGPVPGVLVIDHVERPSPN